jgi:hypothetical protein
MKARASDKATIKDIVYTAAVFGQLDDVIDLVEQDDTLRTVDNKVVSDKVGVVESSLDTLNLLVRCANLSIAEIATDYVPLTTTELVTVNGEFLPYDKLGKTVLDVVKVVSRGGTTVRYKMRPDGIQLPNGKITIEYKYLPPRYRWEDECDYKSGIITSRIVAYGVITEYCIISGLQDDAVLWDGRYRQSLINASSRTSRRVKAMQWLN